MKIDEELDELFYDFCNECKDCSFCVLFNSGSTKEDCKKIFKPIAEYVQDKELEK